jgi:uncharacterized membrane protein YccC
VTEVTTARPAGEFRRGWSDVIDWIRRKDPGLLAIKRSIRAAVVMPAVFGITHLLFTNPQVSLFGAFGAFALLLLVDFEGRPRTRLFSYAVLFAVGAGFIALGTVASTHKVAAVVVMAVVGFGVLFVGIVSPQAATASRAALLTFVLSVAVAQPTAAIGPRLVGWAFAGAFSISACMLVWPTPWHDSLRSRLSATMSAIGRLVAASAEHRSDPEARAAVTSAMTQLRKEFRGTPYPATGSGAGAVALSKLVGRIEWVAGNAGLANQDQPLDGSVTRPVLVAVAETLTRCASLVSDDRAHPVDDPAMARALQESIQHLDQLITTELTTELSLLTDPVPVPDAPTSVSVGGTERGEDDDQEIAFTLDPNFHARALGISTEMMADAVLEGVGAQAVGDRRIGPIDDPSRRMVWRSLASHLSFHSVWFRNAVRGAAGLALAVAVVEMTDVEHGFWVVLGTLSVLRSNALSTGATALRAVGGTAVGVVVGSAVMIGVANHSVLLWVLLPLAVLVSGVAPSMISFAAGQAGFTVVVVILFNIISPVGWRVGLTRIEDVAIGCGVSVVVGLLFWPRGATAALGRALADAFVTSSGYLGDAVDRLTSATRPVDTVTAQRSVHSAYLRLDDAYRQFLAEQGAKVAPVETIAGLFTGSNRLRLAAYMLSALPATTTERGQAQLESVAIAGAVLRDSYAASHRWYEEFAELLSNRRSSLDPLPAGAETLHDVLRTAFEDARARRRQDQLRALLHMLWANELLEGQKQVEVDLAASAGLFARERRKSSLI